MAVLEDEVKSEKRQVEISSFLITKFSGDLQIGREVDNYRVTNTAQPLPIRAPTILLLTSVGLRWAAGAGQAFLVSRFWVSWVHLEIKRTDPKTAQTSTDPIATVLERFLLREGWPCNALTEVAHVSHGTRGTGSWGWEAMNAHRVLCTCKKLEVHDLPEHT